MEAMLSRNLAEMLIFFFIYSFLGWVVEVAFHQLKCGRFINRGMLAGAVCPIYGFGAVIIITLLEPIKNNLFLLFIASAILCTFLEYLAGLALDKLFHKRWWDYSEVPYNIGGYVCMQFSVYWGIGGIILIRDIQSIVARFVNFFTSQIIIGADIIFTIIILIDAAATISSIIKINRKLELLNELQKQIHNVSDFIGENVSEKTSEISDKSKPVIENIEVKKEEVRTRAIEAKKESNKIKESLSTKISKKEFELEQKTIGRINHLSKSIYGEGIFINKDKYSLEELKKKKIDIQNNFIKGEKRLLKAFPNIEERKMKKEFDEIRNNFLGKKDV